MRKKGKNISIYVSEDTEKKINERNSFGNRSYVVDRDINRLYEAYRFTISDSQFSYEEVVTLCLFIKEKRSDEQIRPQDLRRELIFACSREGLHKRSGLADNLFVDIFNDFTYFQFLAFIDGAERVCIFEKTIGLKEAIWKVFHSESDEDHMRRQEQYRIERMSQPDTLKGFDPGWDIPI